MQYFYFYFFERTDEYFHNSNVLVNLNSMSVCVLECVSVCVCACVISFATYKEFALIFFLIFLTHLKNKDKIKSKTLTSHKCTYVENFIVFYRVVSWDSIHIIYFSVVWNFKNTIRDVVREGY